MFKRIVILITLGVTLSGCFMAPMALLGPAASGFSTASLIQSGITSGANYMIKKSTGKTMSEHALDAVRRDVLLQSYFPENTKVKALLPKAKPLKNK
jgi:hypothetical protein